VRFTPDGKQVLVSCAESNQLVVYDAASGKEAVRIALEAVPVGVLVTPDGTFAYVANTQADRVSVIDLNRRMVVGSVEAGREPDGMAWAAW
jgi:YVTN family beta-propeller protein